MKITFFLSFICVFQMIALNIDAQNAVINIQNGTPSVGELIKEIENQTDYLVVYSHGEINTDRKVNVRAESGKVSDFLVDAFHGTNVKYVYDNDYIVLTTSKSNTILQPSRVITGTVKDDRGEPIPGASIIVMGTTIGTTTDLEGTFSLSIPEGNTIRISFIGYHPKEITLGNQRTFNIILDEDTKQLDEVVVIGYGTAKRSDLTGSISNIDASQIKKVPVTNVGQALQGRMSGVQVSNNDGSPGAGTQVLIRGIGSFGDNSPLYVIDGYPGGSLTNVNPRDIQSIDVLKDASAAAIYGNRAANGVIIVTTKRGSKDGLQISVDATASVQFKPKTFDMLNAQEFASLATEVSDIQKMPVLEEWRNPGSLRTIDWQDAMYRTGIKQDYNISIRGGSEKSLSSVSMGFVDHKGIVEFSNYKRYNAALTQDYTPYKWLKSSTNLRYSYLDTKTVYGSGQGGLGRLANMIPTMTGNPLTDQIIDEHGNVGYYDKNANAVRDNHNVYIGAKENDQTNIYHDLNASTSLEVIPIEGLRIKTSFGINFNPNSGYNFSPYNDRGMNPSPATYSQYAHNNFEWLWENTINYSKVFGIHNIDLMVGVSAQENTLRRLETGGNGLVSDGLRNISSLNQFTKQDGYQQTWSLASQFGRASYQLMDRYIITGTIRRDGSSRFAKGNKYGTFPSISGAWKVKEESFMQDISAISNLKIRASYGEAGNQNIGLFQYQSSYTTGYRNGNKGYVFGQDKTYIDGMVQSFLPNPDLKWETSTQTDIGLDLGFFNHKLTLTADYYIKKSKDFLLDIPMPSQTGFEKGTRNVGSIKNNGFELMIDYRNYDKEFKYGINVNFTTVKNKIEKLAAGMEAVSNLSTLDFPNYGSTSWTTFSNSRVGGSIGEFYGFQTDGIIQTQAEIDALNENARKLNNGNDVWYITSKTVPGDRKFVDQNGDGIITDDDRVPLGSPIPDFFGGINFNGEYKNFDFNIFFNYSYGNKILNFVERNMISMGGEGSIGLQNVSKKFYEKRWREDNPTNEYPRAVWSDENGNSRVSDAFVEDGSYLRLKNIEIGYTLPHELTRKFSVSSLRVFLSAQNLFTITGYSGMDPEIGQSVAKDSGIAGGVTASGVDVGIYPYSRFFSMGLNLQF